MDRFYCDIKLENDSRQIIVAQVRSEAKTGVYATSVVTLMAAEFFHLLGAAAVIGISRREIPEEYESRDVKEFNGN